MVDSYLQWAATTGPSFIPAWSNASVAIVALVLFVVGFLASAFSGRQWLFDVAFAALVIAGILVPWPAMVALSLAAVILATALSFLHRAVAPAQAARIEDEADRIAKARTGEFLREFPGSAPGQLPVGAAGSPPQDPHAHGAAPGRRRPDGKT